MGAHGTNNKQQAMCSTHRDIWWLARAHQQDRDTTPPTDPRCSTHTKTEKCLGGGWARPVEWKRAWRNWLTGVPGRGRQGRRPPGWSRQPPIERSGFMSGLCGLSERSGFWSGLCGLMEWSGLWSRHRHLGRSQSWNASCLYWPHRWILQPRNPRLRCSFVGRH